MISKRELHSLARVPSPGKKLYCKTDFHFLIVSDRGAWSMSAIRKFLRIEKKMFLANVIAF